jgi:hypothetical protein
LSADATQSRVCNGTSGRAAAKLFWEVVSQRTLDKEEALRLDMAFGPEPWGAPTMRLRLVDEARLANHDVMRSFLSEDGQHDAASMIAKYAATKPLVNGCRVWRTGGTLDLSHGPLGPTYRKFGRAELIDRTQDSEDAIVSTSFEYPTGVPGEVEYGEAMDVPASHLTTGDPITMFTLGVSFDVLRNRIVWSWPEHISANEIQFQAEGGLILLDTASTAVMTVESTMQKPRSHPQGNENYVAGAFEIVVKGEALPVFVHKWDKTQQEQVSEANARTRVGLIALAVAAVGAPALALLVKAL